MASHFSTLAWKIPWMEEPGRLQSMGSLRVGYDWVTSLSLFTFMHWRRKWQPTPVFLPWESQGWGSLVGCRLRVAQGWTRLKWLSSSMYMSMYEPIHIYFQAISLIQNWITRCTIQTSIYWKVFFPIHCLSRWPLTGAKVLLLSICSLHSYPNPISLRQDTSKMILNDLCLLIFTLVCNPYLPCNVCVLDYEYELLLLVNRIWQMWCDARMLLWLEYIKEKILSFSGFDWKKKNAMFKKLPW